MKKILFAGLITALLTGTSLAQSSTESQTNATASQSTSTSAAQAADSTQLAAGTTIRAELAKTVDAKKAKQGDEVVAKTSDDVKANGQVVIPKGSKLIGHVTDAKARTKGESESMLGIAFDKAILKGGREIPLNATIQALAAPAQNNAANEELSTPPYGGGGAPSSAPGRPQGGMSGGVAPVGSVAGTATKAAGDVGSTAAGTVTNAAGGIAANGQLSGNSQGVVGISGLSLSAAAANNTQGSVVTSQQRNVKLDSGTQMMLRVNSK